MKGRRLDVIEEDIAPHEMVDAPTMEEQEDREIRVPPRLRISLNDLKKFGFTPGCPKCNMHSANQHERARGMPHTEECRLRIYKAMENEGSQKLKNALAQGRARISEPKDADDIPLREDPLERMDDIPPPSPLTRSEVHGEDIEIDDTHNDEDDIAELFGDFDEPEADMDNGDDGTNGDDNAMYVATCMKAIADNLQTLGDQAATSVGYASTVVQTS